MAIDPISAATLSLVQGGTTSSTAGGTSDATGSGLSFGDLLGSVEHADTDANTAVSRMLDGSGDVHEAMIALQKADVMLQLTVQIRNKLVAAYNDVIKMPI